MYWIYTFYELMDRLGRCGVLLVIGSSGERAYELIGGYINTELWGETIP